MIIGVNGYGYSGSGAVLDLLKEYEDIAVHDAFEFQMIHEPDGILDLAHSLVDQPTRMGSNAALRRFERNCRSKVKRNTALVRPDPKVFLRLCDAFVEALSPLSWKGYSYVDPPDLVPVHDHPLRMFCIRAINEGMRILNIPLVLPKRRERYFSILDQEAFDLLVRRFLLDILALHGIGGEMRVAINQPFSSVDPLPSMQYMEDSKAVLVDRDPRDLYLLAKKVDRRRSRFIPTDTPEKFAAYYRLLHARDTDIRRSNRVLCIRFEDLIYRHEETVTRIEAFVGVSKHTRRLAFFDPMISMVNTRLFEAFPQYQADIDVLEKSLGPWLYHFDASFSAKPPSAARQAQRF